MQKKGNKKLVALEAAVKSFQATTFNGHNLAPLQELGWVVETPTVPVCSIAHGVSAERLLRRHVSLPLHDEARVLMQPLLQRGVFDRLTIVNRPDDTIPDAIYGHLRNGEGGVGGSILKLQLAQ